ncbi:MAG: hypothetical protein PHU65_02965 [Actinomycetota bacterium]|nr:hypothetical protein [Actinomycetota bacterium]
MNIFNKIIVVILLIFFIGISAFGILNAFVKWISWPDIALMIFNPNINFGNQYIIALIFLFVIVFCIFLLVLEFYRRKRKTAVVAAVREGTALITLDSIANQIKENLLKIAGTKDLNVRVLPKSSGIIINIFSKICEDCNVPLKMQEIIKTAAGFAAEKLGLKVVKTNLTIMNLTNIDYRAKENKIGTEKYVLPEEPSVSEKTNEPEGNKTEEGTENNIPDERNLIVSEENKDIQSFQADDGNNEPEADKPST